MKEQIPEQTYAGVVWKHQRSPSGFLRPTSHEFFPSFGESVKQSATNGSSVRKKCIQMSVPSQKIPIIDLSVDRMIRFRIPFVVIRNAHQIFSRSDHDSTTRADKAFGRAYDFLPSRSMVVGGGGDAAAVSAFRGVRRCPPGRVIAPFIALA